MESPQSAAGPWPSYRWLLAGWLCFVLYGSLVPFDFVAVPVSDVLHRLDLAHLDFSIESRSDFVANVLLMIPAGLLAAAACLQHGSSRTRAAAGVLAVSGAAAMMSAAVEVSQSFLPDRVMSPSDVVAQTIGTAAGALTWLMAGPSLAAAVEAVRPARQPGRIGGLFAGYVPGLLAWRLFPMDLTLSPSALHRKYLEGRIFGLGTAHFPVTALAWWGSLTSILIYMPVGVGAGLLWGGERPRPGVAIALAAMVVVAAEFGRVLVLSASANLAPLATGFAGVAAGVWMGQRAGTSWWPHAVGRSGIRT